MKIKSLLILCLLIVEFVFSQRNTTIIDSLKNILNTQENDRLIATLNELSWEFKNVDIDSAFFYARLSVDKSKKINRERSISMSFNSLASCFDAIGRLDSARKYHKKSLNIKLKLKDTIGIADTYNNLGINADEQGNYKTALDYYFKSLKGFESIDSILFNKIPMVLSNIGIVYKKQKEYNKVLLYYNKALKIYEDNNYDFGIAVTKGNIGSVLINLKQYKQSIKYSYQAKDKYENMGYQRYIPYMLMNIAIAKDSLNHLEASHKAYEKAKKMFVLENNFYELTNAHIGLARLLKKKGLLQKALINANEALDLSVKYNYKEFVLDSYRVLADVKKSEKDYEFYAKYLELYSLKKDSLFEETKTKAIIELETKYETEKKEKEILIQRAQIVEKELKLNRKQNQIIGLIILALLLLVLGYFIYNQEKLKNKQLQKESDLKEALAKIETQNKLQEQRINISRDLHDNIGAQLTFIISTIENLQYGFNITNDKLKNKLTNIGDFTRETITELRDTIWAMNKDEILLQDLKIRIFNFVEKAKLTSSSKVFTINIDEILHGKIIFSSILGMNIFRIVQEAVNNAIKYANANHINIKATQEGENIIFSIQDDGQGFDIETMKKGNGLNNMIKRADEIKANIFYISSLGKGTTIKLELCILN